MSYEVIIRIRRADGRIDEIPTRVTQRSTDKTYGWNYGKGHGIETVYDPPLILNNGDEILSLPSTTITIS